MIKRYNINFRKNGDSDGGFVSNEYRASALYDFSQEPSSAEMRKKISEVLSISQDGAIPESLLKEGFKYLGQSCFTHYFRFFDDTTQADIKIRTTPRKFKMSLRMKVTTTSSEAIDGLEESLRGVNDLVLAPIKSKMDQR